MMACHIKAVTSRSCSKAPAVNPDCSNHLVNIMRATVCLCDQSLCNGLFALANYSTSLNSRIFSSTGTLLTNNNNQNNNNNNDNTKENFMPLHDFNEQRIAAMLGTNKGQASSPQTLDKMAIIVFIIFSFMLIVMPQPPNLLMLI